MIVIKQLSSSEFFNDILKIKIKLKETKGTKMKTYAKHKNLKMREFV